MVRNSGDFVRVDTHLSILRPNRVPFGVLWATSTEGEANWRNASQARQAPCTIEAVGRKSQNENTTAAVQLRHLEARPHTKTNRSGEMRSNQKTRVT